MKGIAYLPNGMTTTDLAVYYLLRGAYQPAAKRATFASTKEQAEETPTTDDGEEMLVATDKKESESAPRIDDDEDNGGLTRNSRSRVKTAEAAANRKDTTPTVPPDEVAFDPLNMDRFRDRSVVKTSAKHDLVSILRNPPPALQTQDGEWRYSLRAPYLNYILTWLPATVCDALIRAAGDENAFMAFLNEEPAILNTLIRHYCPSRSGYDEDVQALSHGTKFSVNNVPPTSTTKRLFKRADSVERNNIQQETSTFNDTTIAQYPNFQPLQPHERLAMRIGLVHLLMDKYHNDPEDTKACEDQLPSLQDFRPAAPAAPALMRPPSVVPDKGRKKRHATSTVDVLILTSVFSNAKRPSKNEAYAIIEIVNKDKTLDNEWKVRLGNYNESLGEEESPLRMLSFISGHASLTVLNKLIKDHVKAPYDVAKQDLPEPPPAPAHQDPPLSSQVKREASPSALQPGRKRRSLGSKDGKADSQAGSSNTVTKNIKSLRDAYNKLLKKLHVNAVVARDVNQHDDAPQVLRRLASAANSGDVLGYSMAESELYDLIPQHTSELND